jgi:hypothetical protein
LYVRLGGPNCTGGYVGPIVREVRWAQLYGRLCGPNCREVRWAQLYGRLCGPQGRSGRERRRGNLVPIPGFEPRTVKPVERIGYCGSDLNIALPHTKQWTAMFSSKFFVCTYANGVMYSLRLRLHTNCVWSSEL